MWRPVRLIKGETLYDTILTLSALGVDVCVIRHPEVDYFRELIASPSITTSIINGGDGSGQHLARACLIWWLFMRNLATLRVLQVAIAGDLDHSRVCQIQYADFWNAWQLNCTLRDLRNGEVKSLRTMDSL